MPCSSNQSPTASSRSATSIAVSVVPDARLVAYAATAFSWRWMIWASCARSYGPSAMRVSLWRIPATRSRSVAVALVAAAAGLLSSCVSPADNEPESLEPLPLTDRLLRALLAEEEAFEQVHRHGEPVVHEAGEVGGVQHVVAGGLEHPQRLRVGLRDPVTQVGRPGSGVHAHLAGARDLDVVGTHPAVHRQRAVEQDVEARRRLALAVQHAGVDVLDVPRPHSQSSCSSLSRSNRKRVRSSAMSQGRCVRVVVAGSSMVVTAAPGNGGRA